MSEGGEVAPGEKLLVEITFIRDWFGMELLFQTSKPYRWFRLNNTKIALRWWLQCLELQWSGRAVSSIDIIGGVEWI